MMKEMKHITAVMLFMLGLLQGITAMSMEVESSAAAEKYDGRDFRIITPVREQGNTTLCWAYSATSAAEVYLLKYGIVKNNANTSVLSPTQLGYVCHSRGADPLGNTSAFSSGKDYRTSEGSSAYAQVAFSQWCAPVAANMADNCDGWANSQFRLKESVTLNSLDTKNSEEARLEIKKAIVKYGAVTFSYNNKKETYYYNPSNETGGESYPHACTIIGWDDSLSKDVFLPGGAEQNGGWLVKNSYSSLPYFYLSYDNTSNNVYAFALTDKERYDYNYFYDSDMADFGVGAMIKPKGAANIFVAKKGDLSEVEYISAVNVGIDGGGGTITVDIYTDIEDETNYKSGTLAATETLSAEYSGYYTIELENPIPIKKGSMFSAVAQISGNSDSYVKLTQNSGKSFIKRGTMWSAAATAPRVKVYTKTSADKMFLCDDEVWVRTGENENGVFILNYSKNKKTEDIETFEVSENKVYRFEIPKTWSKDDGRNLCGMLWKSLDSMIPLTTDRDL